MLNLPHAVWPVRDGYAARPHGWRSVAYFRMAGVSLASAHRCASGKASRTSTGRECA